MSYMKVEVEEISSAKKRLIVEIEAKEVEQGLDKAYKELGKSAKIKGFRPGKVPRKLLEAKFGDQVVERVSEEVIKETLPKAVEENTSSPLAFEVVEKGLAQAGRPLRYEALVQVRPDFEVRDYLGLEVKKERVRVTDDDVDRRLESMRESRCEYVSVDGDRPVENHDHVRISYEGFEGQRPLDGMNQEDFVLRVGDHDFHPEFEEALLGLRKGETKEVIVAFKADHPQPKLAGRRYRFKVKLLDILKRVLPEVNDDFAGTVAEDVGDLGGLREKVRADITREEERRTHREMRQRLIEKISEGVEVELPEILVQTEIDGALESYRLDLKRGSSGSEESRLDEAGLRAELRPAAENRVKWMLVLGQIATQHDLSISEAELDRGFLTLSEKTGKDVQRLRRFHEDHNMIDSLRQSLLEEKVLDFLMEASVVKEVEPHQLRNAANREVEP
jgi:trigger factor